MPENGIIVTSVLTIFGREENLITKTSLFLEEFIENLKQEFGNTYEYMGQHELH